MIITTDASLYVVALFLFDPVSTVRFCVPGLAPGGGGDGDVLVADGVHGRYGGRHVAVRLWRWNDHTVAATTEGGWPGAPWPQSRDLGRPPRPPLSRNYDLIVNLVRNNTR